MFSERFRLAALPTLVIAAGLGPCTELVAEADEAGAGALEEVVVRARKRTEYSMDVPISMTVLDAAAIEKQSATALKDIWGNIPNASMDVTGNSLSSWGMRGIVSQTRNPGQESGLGIYVDGVYLGRPAGFNVPMHDIQSIEVLRGPQGSLFGRNTIAGAINVHTRRPTGETAGWLQGAFGNLSRADLQAGISGTLSESSLAGKISVFRYSRDGYVDNIFNGARLQSDDRKGGRAALYWTPNDGLEVTLAADFMAQDNTLLGGATQEPQLNNFVPGWYFEDRFVVNQNDPGMDRIDTGGVSLTFDWRLPNGLDFRSISSYRLTDLETLNDDDAGPVTLTWSHFDDDSHTFTQEFLFNGAANERVDYLLGFYYLDIRVTSNRVTGLFTPYPVREAAITSDSTVDTRSWAIFGTVDYALSDLWTASLGLRYTNERKSSAFRQTENGGLGFPNVSFDPTLDDDGVSGDMSLTWAATDSLNVYGSIRKGFKSGGFQTDIINFDSEDLFVFGPEAALSYELGLKSRFAGDRLSADLAVFRTDYEDIQVGQLVGLGFTTRNAATSEIRGMELQLDYLPLDELRIGFKLGLLDSEYTDFDDCAGLGTSCAGSRLQYAPDATAAAEVAYTLPLANNGVFDFYLSFDYRGSYFVTAVNDPRLEIPDRTLANARVAYTFPHGRFSLALWGRNLGDSEWELTRWQYPVTPLVFGGFDPTITGLQRTAAEPRTYGIELLYRF